HRPSSTRSGRKWPTAPAAPAPAPRQPTAAAAASGLTRPSATGIPGIRPAGNQQARYRAERSRPLPAERLPGVTGQEQRPDAGGPGPQEVGPEAVADEDRLAGIEASQG